MAHICLKIKELKGKTMKIFLISHPTCIPILWICFLFFYKQMKAICKTKRGGERKCRNNNKSNINHALRRKKE